MTTEPLRPQVANLKFTHMGLSVREIAPMERFYTEVLGFTVTDRGNAEGMELVFLSRDPTEHHQIVLATGRPDHLPDNTKNTQFGPSINQLSFKMSSIGDLRDIRERLESGGGSHVFPANHGIAWSVYAHDPEHNNLEFYVDSDWYINQPFLIPLDLTQTDDEIRAKTLELCSVSEGFEPYGDWRGRTAARMTPYIPLAAAG